MNYENECPIWDGEDVVYGGFVWRVLDLSDGEIQVWPTLGWEDLGCSFHKFPRPSIVEEVEKFVRDSLR